MFCGFAGGGMGPGMTEAFMALHGSCGTDYSDCDACCNHDQGQEHSTEVMKAIGLSSAIKTIDMISRIRESQKRCNGNTSIPQTTQSEILVSNDVYPPMPPWNWNTFNQLPLYNPWNPYNQMSMYSPYSNNPFYKNGTHHNTCFMPCTSHTGEVCHPQYHSCCQLTQKDSEENGCKCPKPPCPPCCKFKEKGKSTSNKSEKASTSRNMSNVVKKRVSPETVKPQQTSQNATQPKESNEVSPKSFTNIVDSQPDAIAALLATEIDAEKRKKERLQKVMRNQVNEASRANNSIVQELRQLQEFIKINKMQEELTKKMLGEDDNKDKKSKKKSKKLTDADNMCYYNCAPGYGCNPGACMDDFMTNYYSHPTSNPLNYN